MNNPKALLIIDLQKDYFAQGKYPLHNTEQVLRNIELAIDKAKQQRMPIILVQHIGNANAPFFNKGTSGAEIHPAILKALSKINLIEKSYADSFEQTNLEQLLQKYKVTELLLTGMMTQNCITHTAISKAADKYAVTIVMDCCTTVDEMVHKIALNAVATRVNLNTMEQVFGGS